MKIKFDHYFTSAEETKILEDLQREHPDLMRFFSLCKSYHGKDVWAVEITNPKTGPMDSKPAFHVDGLTHSGELTGSMCAMYYIYYLLENYGKIPEVTKLVDGYALYVVPCISPDGMDFVLTSGISEPRSSDAPYPYDKKEPGLFARDLDGDGMVRLMRRKAPYGAWKVSPGDPRFMVRRDPSDTGGTYYDLFKEGEYIGEYDGGEIEELPSMWGYDFNRNFPVAWSGHAVQKGAGEYPLCLPETKAMADYILARKNISAVVTGHTMGGVFFYPPGPFPEAEAFGLDMEMYRAMAKIGYEETEYLACNLNTDEMRASIVTYGRPQFSHGAFDDWMYIEEGILATTVEFWNARYASGLPNDNYDKNGTVLRTPDENVSDFNHVLAWLDKNFGQEVVKPWTKFDHPVLGEVEIGLIDPMFCTRNPPPSMLEEEIHKVTLYCVRHALCVPKLEITNIKAKMAADGVYRVTATVSNTGYMPTYGTKQAIAMNKAEEVVVKISAPAGILEGGASRKIGHLEGFVADKSQPNRGIMFWTQNHAPRAKVVHWLVYGKPGDEVSVTAVTPRAGTATATVKL